MSMFKVRLGAAGFIVVLGCMAIVFMAFPLVKYLVALAVAVGGGIAIGLYLAHRWKRA